MAKKILVVGPSWVGDMVMAQTLFKQLKKRQPGVLIDVLAPNYTGALLSRMPEVAQHVELPFGHGELKLRARYQLGCRLREQKYTQAIVLPNSLKSALIPAFAKIPLRTGFIGEMRYGVLNDARKLNKQQLPYMIQRFAKLADTKADITVDNLEQLPWPKLVISDELKRVVVNNYLPEFKAWAHRLIALCPGAEYGPAKRWPVEKYSVLANELLKKQFVVCIIGGPKEQDIANVISHNAPGVINLCNKTKLADAVDILSLSSCVVTNDSGLMHIAAAVDAPVVALYGSSSPSFTPPLTQKRTVISKNLECSPCFKRECPLEHMNCLNTITPKEVMQAITEYL